ncbi:uncharacterized protein LOC128549727 [Mercenaria mercenaria]|uniref:uncharacterized protein LOC128549727 n=1 Tax=Mercenaria mercenaria TaxID=6596 RepID=UPI00234E55B1|nr:uncharacterized protein LOC128549727 [Mercenaria mercenaria]
MASNEDIITRGHEHYLRYLLLLGQAAPVALKALCRRQELNSGTTLNSLILEKKETFKQSQSEHFVQLFHDDSVNTNIESWDTHLLCVVLSVLFEQRLSSPEHEGIDCIRDQRKDLDNFASSASLSFNTFKSKWDPLHKALLELSKDIDDQAKLECKLMIHSFYSEPITVNWKLINKFMKIRDVDMHVKLAIEDKVVPKIHGEKEELNGGNGETTVSVDNGENEEHEEETDDVDSTDLRQDEEVAFFIENLQDTFVYVGDPAILTCKLNVAEKIVTWRKDFNIVEETEALKFLNDRSSHWLAISSTMQKDTGNFSCVCGSASTAAMLKVTEKPLKIIKEIQVELDGMECRENMDIDLVCKVNLPTKKPIWRHNNIPINSNRISASATELEHKLTILNVRFEDEGEYTVDFGDVTSSTILVIKGNVDLIHKKQLTEELYKNWIRCALGLKYLKFALEGVSDRLVRNQHSEFMKSLENYGTECTQCSVESLLPSHNEEKKKKNCRNKKCLCAQHLQNRVFCPSGGFCSQFYDLVVQGHRFVDPLLANTDIQNWSSEPWSVATCYISTTGYKGKTSAKEIDCAGLLSLFMNDLFVHTSLGDVYIDGEKDLFKQARDARNDILHNPNYEISEGQLDEYIDLFKNVLEIKDMKGVTPLLSESGVKAAIHGLNELKNKQIDIHIFEDLQQHIKNLREHAMNEVAEKFEQAEKEKDIRIQHLEEKLQQTEKELRLMNDLRSVLETRKQSKEQKVPFELELHIRVLRTTRESSVQGNSLVYRLLTADVNNHSNRTIVPLDYSTTHTYQKTIQSVRSLLGHIYALEQTQVGSVLQSQTSVELRIRCFTCKAVNQLLAYFNGMTFQEERIELRKSLGIEVNGENTYDVLASCSSQSIDNTRRQLRESGVIKEITSSFTCSKHQNRKIVWYCSDHEHLCCIICRETDHRSCVGPNRAISDKRDEKVIQKSLSVKTKMGSYNVKLYDQKVAKPDGPSCSILKICVLPKGKILLADRDNSRLKKLDKSYKLISYCELPDYPFDACYVGNQTAAVSVGDAGIQFVNISGKMKLRKLVKLDHFCLGLDSHEDNLYVTSRDTVFSYKKDASGQRVLYHKQEVNDDESLGHIVASEDGKLLYLSDVNGGLVTIDSTGTHLNTLKNDVLQGASGLCLVSDGTILVTDENTHSVHQVDYNGELVLGKVVTREHSTPKPWSVCYDKNLARLIVGYFYENHITVYELQ